MREREKKCIDKTTTYKKIILNAESFMQLQWKWNSFTGNPQTSNKLSPCYQIHFPKPKITKRLKVAQVSF